MPPAGQSAQTRAGNLVDGSVGPSKRRSAQLPEADEKVTAHRGGRTSNGHGQWKRRLANQAKLFSEPHRKPGPGKRRDGMEEEVSQLWMIEKEPEHLLRGVRSLRICVGSGGTAT
jgi:hypothetical protein